MKLYKFKYMFIKNIERCTDWKILKKVVLFSLDEINKELKRPRIVKSYKNSKRRSPRAIKLERELYKKNIYTL